MSTPSAESGPLSHEFLVLPESMSRGRVDATGRLAVETGVPVPVPEENDLLFRTLAVGLGPADLHPTGEDYTPAGIPVAEIAAVGDNVRGWNPLDRALLLPTLGGPGIPPLEGLAPYVRASAAHVAGRLVLRLPEEIPAEDATLVPAAALASRLWQVADVPREGGVLVVGLGLVGQILTLLARHQRAGAVIGVDASATLRQRAEWSGAGLTLAPDDETLVPSVRNFTQGRGVHAVVALGGSVDSLPRALSTLGPRGAFVVAASFPGERSLSFPLAHLHRTETRIQGVQGFESRHVKEALQSLRLGVVNAETLVSRRIPWEDLAGSDLTTGYWRDGTHVVVEPPPED